MDNDIFDDEFYYREGLADEQGDFEDRLPKPDTIFDQGSLTNKFPGTKCPRATNRIV